jgi:hypothetical protein
LDFEKFQQFAVSVNFFAEMGHTNITEMKFGIQIYHNTFRTSSVLGTIKQFLAVIGLELKKKIQ